MSTLKIHVYNRGSATIVEFKGARIKEYGGLSKSSDLHTVFNKVDKVEVTHYQKDK